MFISQLDEQLVIAGVIEVKSHRAQGSGASVAPRRAPRHGVRIGGRDWSPDDVHIGVWSAARRAWSTTSVLADAPLQPFRLLVRVRLARRGEALLAIGRPPTRRRSGL